MPQELTDKTALPELMLFHFHVALWGPFSWRVLTLIPARISNYIHYKVWDEITYPFLNFNGATIEV